MKRDQVAAALGMMLAMTATVDSQAATLKWGSSPGAWEVGITTNWYSGANPATFNNGDSVTFDNFGASFATNIVTIATNVVPASVTVAQVGNYVFSGSGSITGTCGLFKTGTGSLTINNANSYTGGTTITGGSLVLNNAAGAGTGPITNSGAALTIAGYYLPNVLNCTGNTVLTNTTGTGGIGALSGSGTLAISSVGRVFDLTGNMTAYGGTLYLSNCTSGVRCYGTAGSSAATFDLGAGAVGMTIRNGATAIALGGLAGGTNTALSGNSSANWGAVFSIGANNASTTFRGRIANGGGGANATTALDKLGSGALTLAGTNTYSGPTTVTAGTLALTGPAAITNSSLVTVVSGAALDVSGLAGGLLSLTSGQTLSGSGTIRGSVTVPVGTTLSPGDGIGKLTVTNALTLAGMNVMELNRTNAPTTNDMLLAAAFTVTGLLRVTNLGPALVTGDSFKLFSAPVSGFATVNLPVSDGATTYVWTNKLAIDGSIQVLSGASPIPSAPTNINGSYDGVHLTLSWPANYTGWLLQTNAVGVNVTNAWFTLPGSANTNRIIVTPDPAKANVFYRLAYPQP